MNLPPMPNAFTLAIRVQAQPKKSVINLRGWRPSPTDFKFATANAYVCTSILGYEETGELKLWNQTPNDYDNIDWGRVCKLLEDLRLEFESEDNAWMLYIDAIKERFKSEVSGGMLGKQFWGDRKAPGEGFPAILAHWQTAVRATSAPACLKPMLHPSALV